MTTTFTTIDRDLPNAREQEVLAHMATVSPPGRTILLHRPSKPTIQTIQACARQGWVEELFHTADGIHVCRLTQSGCFLAMPQ